MAGAGSSCYWNAGDEAILAGMLKDLRQAIPGVDITLASRNPEGALARYGVSEVPLQDLSQVIAAAKNSDLLVLGGGGIFYDYWGADPAALLTPRQTGIGTYAGFALLASLLDKPLMIYAVGVGPLLTDSGRNLARLTLEQADAITVRDPGSLEMVRTLGLQADPIQLTADPAFSLEMESPEWAQQILEAETGPRPSRPLLGVALRPWDIGVAPEEWERQVAQTLDRFLDDHDGLACFIPFHRADGGVDDEAVAARICQRMTRQDRTVQFGVEYTPAEKIGLLGACDLVLGMRLHSIVFSIMSGVPFVALSYDPKVSALAAMVGLSDYAVEIGRLTQRKLTRLLDSALGNRSRIAGDLGAQAPRLRELAGKSAELAADLLARKPASVGSLSSETVERLKGVFVAQTESLHELQMSRDRTEIDIDRLKDELQFKDRVLNDIVTSRAWALAMLVRRTRQRLAPDGSRRKILLHSGLTALAALLRADLNGFIRALARPLKPLPTASEAEPPPRPPRSRWSLLGVLRGIYLRFPAALRAKSIPVYRRIMGTRLAPVTSTVIAEASSRASAAGPYAPSPAPAKGQLRVPILTPKFFNEDGGDMFAGGAERYLIELNRLIRSMGYRPEVYQAARGSWVRCYGDMRVTGLDTVGDVSRLNEVFHARVPPGRLTIYLAFYLAHPRCHPGSIGISHGIYWDNSGVQSVPDIQRQNLGEVLSALANLSQVVSVDTNTVNWVRSVRIELADRFTYIPNFVDTERFRPADGMPEREGQDDRRTIVLYPRRLYGPRGFWLVADILPELLEEHPELEFHFVGKADPPEAAAAEELARRHPDRVRWYDLPPDRMHEAYQKAQVTIIPTLSSEGTSLSCLEAMACENAVIATNVGGLPNLILHDFNGLMVEPQASAIKQALSLLLRDAELRQRLAQRGREVAATFNIERWRQQWKQVLARHLPERPPLAAARTGPIAIFPTAPGITWEPVKQRPHHIAIHLAANGIETFWGNPDGQRTSELDLLHIGNDEDVPCARRPLVLIYYPFHYEKLKEYDEPFVIYDVLDDISIHDRSDAQAKLPPGRRARDYHQLLLEQADLVITSSHTLQARLRQQRPDAVLVLNGVDLAHFTRDGLQVPKSLTRIGSPIIGYHGALAEWVDFELLMEVARLRRDYRFALVGPVSSHDRFEALQAEPNVHYFGSQLYEDVPRFVAGFDVGIMPFIVDKMTKGVRPLKVLECLAMGVPVVAVPLPELHDWPGVFLADGAEAWAGQLDRALEARAEVKGDPQIRALVEQADWSKTIRPLLEAIKGKAV